MNVLYYIIGSIFFTVFSLFIFRFIRKKNPNPEKLSSYESGEEASGNMLGAFNIKYYVGAILFILFDIEIIFLVPILLIFKNTTNIIFDWIIVGEIVLFLFVVSGGLLFVWKKGILEWYPPQKKTSDIDTKVPYNIYKKVGCNGFEPMTPTLSR